MLAIRELEQKRQRSPAAVEEFLQQHEFPLVEGSTVTFVYRGEADAVRLMHWIYGLSSSQDFERLPGTDLWFLVMEVPEGSRVEYKLELVHGPEQRLVQDPLNPHLARDPYGANSVVHAAGYVQPDWVDPDPEARQGELVDHVLASDALAAACSACAVDREPRKWEKPSDHAPVTAEFAD